MDFTNWVHIPTPEFVINSRPNTIDLRPGEEKTFVVNVNSTTGFEPLVRLSAINLTGIELKFQHNQLHLPSYGLQTVPLQIKVSENATARPYLLHLFANATFPSESLINSPSSAEDAARIHSTAGERGSIKTSNFRNRRPAILNYRREDKQLLERLWVSIIFCLWDFCWTRSMDSYCSQEEVTISPRNRGIYW